MLHCEIATLLTSGWGLVSRVPPVQTALRNCTRDEGRPFEVGNQVLISSHRKLLLPKATVVNVAEKSKMPRMDGMETLRRLRQKSDMPVIFLTSKDEGD